MTPWPTTSPHGLIGPMWPWHAMACRQNLGPRLGVLSRVLRRCRDGDGLRCKASKCRLSLSIYKDLQISQTSLRFLPGGKMIWPHASKDNSSHVATRKHPLRLIPKYFSERFSNSLSLSNDHGPSCSRLHIERCRQLSDSTGAQRLKFAADLSSNCLPRTLHRHEKLAAYSHRVK